MQQENEISLLNIFKDSQQTFEEAKKKLSDESGSRLKHFRMQKDATYRVRVLPLAPVIDKDGNALPMTRKGYEYPVKNLLLKIDGKDSKGKDKQVFVNVCNTGYVFPELKSDPIDTYVSIVSEKYSDDEALVKKIKGNSFDGGLKWNSGRSMYILDTNQREEGIQILTLSYSQYKDLEDRKMQVWEKLLKKSPKSPCPLSSINNAYAVEITRKTENKKVGYVFNIDTLSDVDALDSKELKALLDSQRLPDVIYRYNRYHLEATVASLTQMDEKLCISVMNDKRMTDCIDRVKMSLPAEDVSHFSIDGSAAESSGSPQKSGLGALWDTYDTLVEKGLDDKSEEGCELRADIKEFIENNDLDVTASRSKTNRNLLEEIEDALEASGKKQTPDDDREEAEKPRTEAASELDDSEPEDSESTPSRDIRNDDTSEPAARPERRAARPERLRR